VLKELGTNIFGIDRLLAAGGNSVLAGSDGFNILTARAGRNILIGGNQNSVLKRHSGGKLPHRRRHEHVKTMPGIEDAHTGGWLHRRSGIAGDVLGEAARAKRGGTDGRAQKGSG